MANDDTGGYCRPAAAGRTEREGNDMKSRSRASRIEALRRAIDCLPTHTRVAMLEGVRSNEIIVGAYTSRDGGICPMLAAHRCGGRTSFATFAKAWDRFTDARGRARRASERELRILVAHLEASLLTDERHDFQAAIDEHAALVQARRSAERARRSERVRPGDPDRSREMRERGGWSWLRVFRRLDDYERALERVEAERDALLAARRAAREDELTRV
jgi:hypothetical protein